MLRTAHRAPQHDLTGLSHDELDSMLRMRAGFCRRDRAAAMDRAEARGGRVKLTSDESARLDDLIAVLIQIEQPMTVRSVFYRLVSLGAIEKTEVAYTRMDGRLIKLRDLGRVDLDGLVDLSRRIRLPFTFSSAGEAARYMARNYERDIWLDQDVKV